MCVERLVADEGQAIDAGHKSIEACDVVAIARQRNCRARLRRRDLRRPTAARFANGLFLSPRFAPAWSRHSRRIEPINLSAHPFC
jgi:hypothetical protein